MEKLLGSEMISQIRQTFELLSNGAQGLPAATVQSALAYCGARYTEVEVQEILQKLTGRKEEIDAINVDQFIELITMTLGDCDRSAEIQDAFASLDKDGDGQLGKSDIDPVIAKEGDLDADGKLTLADFDKLISTM
eukprot:ANDGO_00706.mRNA.1 Calmodulin